MIYHIVTDRSCNNFYNLRTLSVISLFVIYLLLLYIQKKKRSSVLEKEIEYLRKTIFTLNPKLKDFRYLKEELNHVTSKISDLKETKGNAELHIPIDRFLSIKSKYFPELIAQFESALSNN